LRGCTLEESNRGEVYWCSNPVPSPYGVSLWKNIRWGWPTFSCCIHFGAGDGSKVRFWHDRWCGENALAICFPDSFTISQAKEASVADLLQM